MFKSLDKFVFYNFNYYQHYPFHKWKTAMTGGKQAIKVAFMEFQH